MKDVIVCGADDSAFRVRLPRESDLTLSRAINAEHAAEETWKHDMPMRSSSSNEPPTSKKQINHMKIKINN